jgi:TonB family protein
MFRSLPALLTRPSAWAASLALHLGAVVMGGHALTEGPENRTGSSATAEIDVQLDKPAAPVAAQTSEGESRVAAPARTPGAAHRHAYPMTRDHDAHPHDPSLVHLLGRAPLEPSSSQAASAPAPSSEAPSSEAPLRFVLGSAGLTTRGTAPPAGTALDIATSGSNGSAHDGFDSPVVSESAVDQPARLLSSVPVAYPELARAAGMEADVLLELVVDRDGRVTSARHLSPHGLGLADAALRSVRAYRFTPARRAGRTVPVRMRWTVTFRLQ